MNHKQFFKEGKWMPSFAVFGNRELVFHHPIQAQGETSSLKAISFNPSYPAQAWLAQQLSKQLYSLTKNLRSQPSKSHSLKIAHLRNMMCHVVKAAQEQTLGYHNVLYLTLKHLACLVTKQADKKGVNIDDYVTVESWLADLHSIYFENEQNNKQEEGQEAELLSLLRTGKYEYMISKLRYLYCVNAKNGEKDTLQKIDHIVRILLTKLSNRGKSKFSDEQLHNFSKRLLQSTKEKLNQLNQNANKKINQRKGTTDVYSIISKVLLGDEDASQKLSEKSWPLYLMNQLAFGNSKSGKISANYIVQAYTKKHDHYGKASEKETTFYLQLIGGEASNNIYQKLFELVPPFYAHLIGYLLTIIQPNPLANLFVEDFTLDIIRNLLDHASQISFETLVISYAHIEEVITDEKFNQAFECLLFYHLNVVDIFDTNEVNQFLGKVKILSVFNLQRFAYGELNFLLNKLFQGQILNRETFLIYGYCAMLYSNTYNYEDLLQYLLDRTFFEKPLDIDFLYDYAALKNQLQYSRDKKLTKEINKIEPLLQRFTLIERILSAESTQQKFQTLSQVISLTYRSIAVLQLIQNVIESLRPEEKDPKSVQFLSQDVWANVQNAFLFAFHYPSERGPEEQKLIDAIKNLGNFTKE